MAKTDGATSRRGRGWLPLVLAAAVVTALVTTLVLRRDDDRDRPGRTVMPSPAAATTTTTVPEGPATFVGTRNDSTQLVLADARTGEVVRVLVDGTEPIFDLALTPDGATVYFSTGTQPFTPDSAPEAGRMFEVATDGATAVEPLGGIAFPALSADGSRLAYALGAALVVRDLRTGAERDHRVDEGTVYDPTFSPDGAWITFVNVNSEATGLYVIDAALAGPARPLLPHGARRYEFYRSATWSPDGGSTMSFVAACCAADATFPPQPTDLAVVDVATGIERRREPLDPWMQRVDTDSTGRHLLFVSTAGDVYRRPENRPLQLVAKGFQLAVW